jgi:hypothetical protein
MFKKIIYLLLLSVVAATLVGSVSADGVDHYLNITVSPDAQKSIGELNVGRTNFVNGLYYSILNDTYYFNGSNRLSFTTQYYGRSGTEIGTETKSFENATPHGGDDTLSFVVPDDTIFTLVYYVNGVWDKGNGNPFYQIAPGKKNDIQQAIYTNFADPKSQLPRLEFFTRNDGKFGEASGLYYYQLSIIGGTFTNFTNSTN